MPVLARLVAVVRADADDEAALALIEDHVFDHCPLDAERAMADLHDGRPLL